MSPRKRQPHDHADEPDLVHDEAEVAVFAESDTLGPCRWAWNEVIYRYHGKYWPTDSQAGFIYGIYYDLAEAIRNSAVEVTPATRSIWSDELSAAELAAVVPMADPPHGHVLDINDEPWRVNDAGRLEPCVEPEDGEAEAPEPQAVRTVIYRFRP